MLALAVLLGSASILSAQEEPQPEPSPQPPEERAPRAGPHDSLAVSLEGEYDDNIIQLSENDKETFEANPESDRFLITSIDDWIAVLRASYRWRTRPFPHRVTAVEPAVSVYDYSENDVKDYQVYRLSVSQELTASKKHLSGLRLWASHIPDYYSREITDDDASFQAGHRVRNSLRYRQDEYGLVLGQEIVNNRFDLRVGWTHQDRDYSHDFDERDSEDDIWSGSMRFRPFARWHMGLEYRYEEGDLEAVGDLPSTVIPDDDVSNRHHAVSGELVFPWTTKRRGRVELEFEREQREFTTDNEFDTFHFGRNDTRWDYEARVRQRLGGKFDLIAGYEHVWKRGNFPEGFQSNEDVTNYDENRYSLGLAWSLRVSESDTD